MELLTLVQSAEAAGIVVVGIVTAALLFRNASRMRNAKRSLRFLKALICFLLAMVYGVVLFSVTDPYTVSLYARPLLLMLLMTLLGREWLEHVP